MTIYLLNIIVVIIWAGFIYNSRVKNKDILFLAPILLLFIFISASRSINVGTDTGGYLKHYDIIVNSRNLSIWNHQMEPFFVLLNKIGGFISSNSQTILLLSAIVTNLLIFLRVYESSPYPWLSIYLFLSLYMYYQSFNGLRQYLAISIVFYASKFIEEEKIFKFLLGILIATQFHTSAIIFLPLYFSKKIVNNKKLYVLSIIVIILLMFNIDNIINIIANIFPGYTVYTESFFSGGAGARDLIISFSFLILGQFITERYGTNKKIKQLELYIIIYFVFSMIALTGSANLVLRMSWYFSIYLILYIPEIIKVIKEPKVRIIILYLTIILTFMFHFYLLSNNFHQVLPYRFFMNNF